MSSHRVRIMWMKNFTNMYGNMEAKHKKYGENIVN